MHNDTACRGATESCLGDPPYGYRAVTPGGANIYDEGLFGFIGIERISRIGSRNVPTTDAMF